MSVGLKFGSSLAGQFWLGVSQFVSWGCGHLRASLWWENPIPIWRTHMWQVHAGCWQEASVAHQMDLPIGLLEHPHYIAAGFSQNK